MGFVNHSSFVSCVRRVSLTASSHKLLQWTQNFHLEWWLNFNFRFKWTWSFNSFSVRICSNRKRPWTHLDLFLKELDVNSSLLEDWSSVSLQYSPMHVKVSDNLSTSTNVMKKSRGWLIYLPKWWNQLLKRCYSVTQFMTPPHGCLESRVWSRPVRW